MKKNGYLDEEIGLEDNIYQILEKEPDNLQFSYEKLWLDLSKENQMCNKFNLKN